MFPMSPSRFPHRRFVPHIIVVVAFPTSSCWSPPTAPSVVVVWLSTSLSWWCAWLCRCHVALHFVSRWWPSVMVLLTDVSPPPPPYCSPPLLLLVPLFFLPSFPFSSVSLPLLHVVFLLFLVSPLLCVISSYFLCVISPLLVVFISPLRLLADSLLLPVDSSSSIPSSSLSIHLSLSSSFPSPRRCRFSPPRHYSSTLLSLYPLTFLRHQFLCRTSMNWPTSLWKGRSGCGSDPSSCACWWPW